MSNNSNKKEINSDKKLKDSFVQGASIVLGKSKFLLCDFFISLLIFIVLCGLSCAVIVSFAKMPEYASFAQKQYLSLRVFISVLLLVVSFLIAVLVLLLLQLHENNTKLREIACIDQLTGLCTKQTALLSLDHELCQAARHRTHVGVCFIDMDNFKNVNDKYGHLVGDKLLNKIAKAMKSCVRSEDIVARFGDDEFLIILCNMTKHDDYQIVVNRLDSVLKENRDLGNGQVVKAEASVGVSVYPEDGANIDELIRFADNAMYEIKRVKKSTHSQKERIEL